MKISPSIILDIIIIGIILVMTFLAAKRGFVLTVAEVAGVVAAAFIAVSLGSAAADMIYDKFLGPKLVSATEDAAYSTTQELVDAAWGGLPDFISDNADALGISKDKINESIDNTGREDAKKAIEKAFDANIRPTVVRITGMACSSVFFVVLAFIARWLARLLNKIFSFSVVGKLNRFLGGITGLLEGGAISIILCVIVGMIASLNGGFWIFTTESLNNSIVAKFLLSVTPFAI